MCTMIADRTTIAGSGKGPAGWFELAQLYVSYDHPYHVQLEHALNLDFVNEATGNRVAVELPLDAARQLAEAILATVDRAEAYEASTEPAAAR